MDDFVACVRRQDEVDWGTGLVLGPRLIATCRHVVEDPPVGEFQDRNLLERVRVSVGNRGVHAKVLGCPRNGLYDDIALLVLDGPIASPMKSYPALVSGMNPEAFDRINRLLRRSASCRSTFESEASGTKTSSLSIRKRESNRRDLVDWYQLDGGHPAGASGGPVWIRSPTSLIIEEWGPGVVIGLVSQGAPNAQTGGPSHAFAVASDTLLALLRVPGLASCPEDAEVLATLRTIDAQVVLDGLERDDAAARDTHLARRRSIEARFTAAVSRGSLTEEDIVMFDRQLRTFPGPDCELLQLPEIRISSVTGGRDDSALPFELLRHPFEGGPVLTRCEHAGTASRPGRDRSADEGGRLLVACTEREGDGVGQAVLEATVEACRAGRHLASISAHDREHGAFSPQDDCLLQASFTRLRTAFEESPPAVLILVCRVCERGLHLLDSERGELTVVPAEQFARLIERFTTLRLVLIAPIMDEATHEDPALAAIDIAKMLHDRGLAAVVAPRMPLPAVAISTLIGALLESLLGNDTRIPVSLEHALAHLGPRLSQSCGLAQVGLRLYARAADGNDTRPFAIRPYRGLLSFQVGDGRFFVGREAEVAQTMLRLDELARRDEPQLVLLVGPSGVGKSSLAKAGLAPTWTARNSGHKPLFTRPSKHSTEQLDIWDRHTAGQPRLLIVDQLEELFSDGIEGERQRDTSATYLQRLWSLATTAGTCVVVTVRVDVLERHGDLRVEDSGGCTMWQLVTQPDSHAIFVGPLDAAALRRVIAEPAHYAGLEFEEGLVETLCEEALDAPGGLPLLELALDKLWLRREGRRLVRGTSVGGGVAAVVTTHANETIEQLADDEQREQARRILVRVATQSEILGTRRRRTTVHALQPTREGPRSAFDAALSALVRSRLVVFSIGYDAETPASLPEGGLVEGGIVELAHELLARRWEDLHGWIQESLPKLEARQNFAQWTQTWKDKGGAFLTRRQLDYVAKVDEDDLQEDMREFRKESERALVASGIAKKRRKYAYLGLVLTLGVLLVLLIESTNRATSARDRAVEQEAIAQARLRQSVVLTDVLIYEILPQLERHPQLRGLRQAITTKLFQMQQALRTTDADTTAGYNLLATRLKRGDEALEAGDQVSARLEYQAALDMAQELADALPFTVFNQALSLVLSSMARLEIRAGNLVAAGAALERALTLNDETATFAPHYSRAQRSLCESLIELGALEMKTQDLVAARHLFERALDIATALVRDPFDQEAVQLQIAALKNLGVADLRSRNLKRALSLLRRAVTTAEGLVNVAPEDYEYRLALLLALVQLGDATDEADDASATLDVSLRAVALAEALLEIDPTGRSPRRALATSLDRLAMLEIVSWQELGVLAVFSPTLTRARKLLLRALALREALVALDPEDIEAQNGLTATLGWIGEVEFRATRWGASRRYFQRMLTIAEAMVATGGPGTETQRVLEVALLKLRKVEFADGNLAEAHKFSLRALMIDEARVMEHPSNALALQDLSDTLCRVGETEVAAGEPKAGLVRFQRSREVLDALSTVVGESPRIAADKLKTLARIITSAARTPPDLALIREAQVAARKQLAAIDKDGSIDDLEISGIRVQIRVMDVLLDSLDEASSSTAHRNGFKRDAEKR